MGVTWRKVWRDLWRNKARTVLVVLATAAGVFSLGMTLGMAGLMRQKIIEAHQATVVAHLRFWTAGVFEQDVLDTISRDPAGCGASNGCDASAIADVEAVATGEFRWRLEGEAKWRTAQLEARPDYEGQRMNRAELLEGDWPTGRALMVERLSANFYGIGPGATVVVDFGQRERRLPVSGVARGQMVLPPQFSDVATFYVTPETLAWLTDQPEGYNGLFAQLDSFSQAGAEEAAQRIGRRLESMGLARTDEGYFITDPDVHWAQEQIDTMLLSMAVMAVISLGLSAFLIVNTMNAVIVQQVWQMGVMKVVGATFWRVARVYLATALIYGALAVLLAVPPSAFAAYAVSAWSLDLFNVPFESFEVVPYALLIQVVVGLAVPLLAALVPVTAGARTTARKAIGTRGLGGVFGRGLLDRVVARVRRLPRPLMLSLRNTFRRKGRIALTLATLVLSGTMFIVIVSVHDSMNTTFDALLADFGHDVMVSFDRPQRAERLVEVAGGVASVMRAEVWSGAWASISLDEGGSRQAYLWGVPPDSAMFSPRVVAGRGFVPGDGRAILLNTKIAEDEGIGIGDRIELTVDEGESTWTVVGLVLNVHNDQRENFVPLDALAWEIGSVNRGNALMVETDGHDLATQQRVARELDLALTARRIDADRVASAVEERETERSMFKGMVGIMASMAAMAAAVGGLGLASTMSINVIERGREIGVMRATGATSPAVAGIFIGEGVLVGVLSWLLAAPISYPGALFFSDALGDSLINIPLEFTYSADGVGFWLLVVIVLSALASLWPALQATRVSVRESLAYE
jgi:putative ABC transport system permease protein